MVLFLHAFCTRIAIDTAVGGSGAEQPTATTVPEMLKVAQVLTLCEFLEEEGAMRRNDEVVQHCEAWLQLWEKGVVSAIADAKTAKLVPKEDLQRLADLTSFLKDALQATEVTSLLKPWACEVITRFVDWQAQHVDANITVLVEEAVKAPTEQLLSHFRELVALLADEAKHCDIRLVDCEDTIEKLLHNSAGIVACSRAGFLARFLRTTNKAKRAHDILQKLSVLSNLADKVDPWGEQSTSQVVFDLASEVGAFRVWVDASRSRFSDIFMQSWSGVSQPASEKAVHDCLRFAAKIMAQVNSLWVLLVDHVCQDVKTAAPPSHLLESPQLFTDEGMQKALAEHMRSCDLPKKAKHVAVMAKLLRDAADASIPVEGRLQPKLQLHRNLGRRCIGAYFAMQKILEVPTDPKDIPSHAVRIVNALKAKGIGNGENLTPLPSSFNTILDKMQKLGDALA